jgi:class 3 adenylate cyclase
MRVFDRIFTYLFPLSLLEPTPWLQTWREKERSDFLSLAKFYFPTVALLWLAHYWLFDLPMKLEPSSSWLLFRAAMAAVAVGAWLYYLSPLGPVGPYRTVAMAAGLVFCVSQSWVIYYYPEAPWIYCFVFVVVCALMLRSSVLKSSAYAIVLIAAEWPGLMAAGVAVPEVLSASGVCIVAIAAVRASYLADIRYFLLNQQNIAAQRRNIELNIEFTDRIKSFIPKQIASRLEGYLRDRDSSVLSAIYEVMRPRKRTIACLFSDIRGFTEGSKELDAFIGDSVLPNIKSCTDAIEDRGGVPRKIGDLVFAYFDETSVHLNLIRAIVAGLDIARINEDQNTSAGNAKIERYILVSVGDAIVGNIGGFDSSVEITALGSPVNFLSRLDELTKHDGLKKYLRSSDLLMCDESLKLLHSMHLQPEVRTIDLKQLDLSIRNFPERTVVHSMRPSESNCRLVIGFYEKLLKEGLSLNEDRSQAA